MKAVKKISMRLTPEVHADLKYLTKELAINSTDFLKLAIGVTKEYLLNPKYKEKIEKNDK